MNNLKAAENCQMRAAFDAEVARAGLIVSADEREDLFAGYCGLHALIAQLPRNLPMSLEPALIALADGAKLAR